MDTNIKALYLIYPKKVGIYWFITSDEYWELQDAYEWLHAKGMVTIKRDEDLRISEVAFTEKGLSSLELNK
jgi:hypothetical protein